VPIWDKWLADFKFAIANNKAYIVVGTDAK